MNQDLENRNPNADRAGAKDKLDQRQVTADNLTRGINQLVAQLNSTELTATDRARLNLKLSVYLDHRAMESYRLGQYQSAIDDSTRAIQVRPGTNFNGYLTSTRARASLALGQYPKAISDFTETISILKRALDNMSELADMRTCHASTLALLALAYSHRGHAYYKSGQYEQAIDDLTTSILYKQSADLTDACARTCLDSDRMLYREEPVNVKHELEKAYIKISSRSEDKKTEITEHASAATCLTNMFDHKAPATTPQPHPGHSNGAHHDKDEGPTVG